MRLFDLIVLAELDLVKGPGVPQVGAGGGGFGFRFEDLGHGGLDVLGHLLLLFRGER